MTDLYIIILIAAVTVVAVLQILLLLKRSEVDLTPVFQGLQSVEASQERTGRSVRDEIGKNREESASAARGARVELSGNLKAVGDTLNQQIATLTQTNDQKLEAMRGAMEQRLTSIQDDGSKRLEQIRTDSTSAAQKVREEVTGALKAFNESTVNTLKDMSTSQRTQFSDVVVQLTKLTETTETKLDAQKTAVDERLKQIQTEGTATSKQLREEVGSTLKGFNDSVVRSMTATAETQINQLAGFSEQLVKLTESNQQKLDGLKDAVEAKLKAIQEDNSKQLDQMRATVDEKLQGTLEKRLGESFKLVSDRLEQVHKGLGEMQAMATSVGDLKRVLTNVKTRGTWGEIQLGALLEQMLSPQQYAANVAPKPGSGERVEFAIRLPGHSDADSVLWLPIDSKFPLEDYQRLVDAAERADADGVAQAGKAFETRLRSQARDIRDKYIAPPYTTDFAILFLPSEGLYAEAVRRPGLPESLQQEFRVSLAGPSTFAALLSSLQMGFRTLAIQERSSEVWQVLGAVKTEFGKFADVLAAVKKKIDEASKQIDQTSVRTRAITRTLREVEALPLDQVARLLPEAGIQTEPIENAPAATGSGLDPDVVLAMAHITQSDPNPTI